MPVIKQQAYRALVADEIDECGLTLLAGRTVGALFVGAVTVTLVVAELLRMAIGEHQCKVIDPNLRTLQHRQAIVSSTEVDVCNPGVKGWAAQALWRRSYPSPTVSSHRGGVTAMRSPDVQSGTTPFARPQPVNHVVP
jgi:hypothetical protein